MGRDRRRAVGSPMKYLHIILLSTHVHGLEVLGAGASFPDHVCLLLLSLALHSKIIQKTSDVYRYTNTRFSHIARRQLSSISGLVSIICRQVDPFIGFFVSHARFIPFSSIREWAW